MLHNMFFATRGKPQVPHIYLAKLFMRPRPREKAGNT